MKCRIITFILVINCLFLFSYSEVNSQISEKPKPAEGPTYVSGTIDTNATWYNDDSPFVVDGNVTVADNATLTIEPGVVVKFNINNYMRIEGTLIAEGTAIDSIIFTSYRDDYHGGDTNGDSTETTPSPSNWSQLYFISPDIECSISYSKILYAGHAYEGYRAITLKGTGSALNVSHSIISHCGTYSDDHPAIYSQSGTNLTVSDCILSDNNGMGIDADGTLNLTNSIIENNGWDGLYEAGTGSWISNNIITNNGRYGIRITNSDCTINDNKISYQTDNYGIYITGENCEVVRDTVQNCKEGIYCSGKLVAFYDNLSSDNEGFGYTIHADAVDEVRGANDESNNGHLAAVGITGGSVDATTQWVDEQQYVVFGNFTVSDNVILTLEAGAILKFNPGNSGITIAGTLIAEGAAGDSIIFTSYYDDDFGDDTNGDYSATSPSPGNWEQLYFNDSDAGCSLSFCKILYAGQPLAGYRAISLYGTGSSLNISHSTISYCRDYRDGKTAIYSANGTNLSISDCHISENDGMGVYSHGTLNLTNTLIENNDNEAIYNAGENSIISDNMIVNNGEYGIRTTYDNCTIVRDTVLNCNDGFYCSGKLADFYDNVSSNNDGFGYIVHADAVDEVWSVNAGTENGHLGAIGVAGGTLENTTQWVDEQQYVVFGIITVSDNKVLTLEGGTILKFSHGNTGITIEGALVAEGAAGDSIIFTSYYDDDFGDDTNGDYSATSPSPGNWDRLYFINPDAGCSLSYCKVLYAGNVHDMAITSSGNGSSLYISNSAIRYTGGSNFAVYSSYETSNIEISDCIISNNNGYGIRFDGELTLTGSTIENNGYDGLYYAGANSIISDCKFISNGRYGCQVVYESCQISNCIAENNDNYGFRVHPNLVAEVTQTDTLSGNAGNDCISVTGGNITQDSEWTGRYTILVGGDIYLTQSSTLNINKGTVIKFNEGDRDLYIQDQSTLIAQGDNIEKVVFTSVKDDAYGGDTNEDGGSSLPEPGDWGFIYFNNASSNSLLGWAVISYGGYNTKDALSVNYCSLGTFSNCFILNNLDRGIHVFGSGELNLNYSDIYGNGYGFENSNSSGFIADATNCYWGDLSGPGGEGPGSGDAVSVNVIYEPYLERSTDNPWTAFVSPVTTGSYNDVIIFNLIENGYKGIIAATDDSGIELYSRTDFEVWQSETSPLTTGEVRSLDKVDFNKDGHEDLLVAGQTGAACFEGDGNGNLANRTDPVSGYSCSDGLFYDMDKDNEIDVVACSGDNDGIWVLTGDGSGNWSSATRPTAENSYNSIAVADLNNDTYPDIVASSSEYHGIQIWYGSSGGNWTAGDPLGYGSVFYALDTGDIDQDGNIDLVVSSSISGSAIRVFYNETNDSWDEQPGPVSSGIFNEIILEDLNGDSRLDLAAASQGSGVKVWIGTENLNWSYWYDPIQTNIYKGLCVDDYTLNGTLDLAAASNSNGISLWENQCIAGNDTIFTVSTSKIEFGTVLIEETAIEEIQIENLTDSITHNVVIYPTGSSFKVAFSGDSLVSEIGPFDLQPYEIKDIDVSFSPTAENEEQEALIIHSSLQVTQVGLTGSGTTYIEPVWSFDINVENSVGGTGNSQVLTFGAGIGATDSLDIEAGESCLPPLPPSDVFDTRLRIEGCEGSITSIHDYYRDYDSFRFYMQPGSGGYPITVSWNPNDLPDGTFLISDIVGGVLVDTLNMADTNQVMVNTSNVDTLVISTLRNSTFAYDLDESWNLISLPVYSEEDSLDLLFPGAISAFGWNDNYVQTTKLQEKKGYWIDMSVDTVINLVGEQVRTIDETLIAGWSLIGTVFDTLSASSIQEDPAGCITSIYGFDDAYFEVDLENGVLLPGSGYWIDMNQDGTVTLSSEMQGVPISEKYLLASDHNRKIDIICNENDILKWQLPIDIASSSAKDEDSRRLVIGAHRNGTSGIDLNIGEREVPPWPPSSIFECRCINGNNNGQYLDLKDSESEKIEFRIVWNSGEGGCPIEISWDASLIPDGIELKMYDGINRSFFGPLDMNEISSYTLPEDLNTVDAIQIVAERQDKIPVTHYALMQNYPNPFNPNTMIRYDIPDKCAVKLQIFDVQGRLIKTLVDRTLSSGRYTAEWNGVNNRGHRVSSGIYFYRLKTRNWSQTKKLIMLR